MRRETAEKIAREFGLIPSHISREILRSIAFGMAADPAVFNYVTRDELTLLSCEYERERTRLCIPPQAPRNWPAYHLIAKEYPLEFDDSLCTDINRQVPRLGGLIPSLSSFLLRRVPFDLKDLAISRRYPDLKADAEVLRAVDQIFQNAHVIWPEPEQMARVVSWFERLREGKDAVAFTPLCPDYSYRKTGILSRPYEYTFDSVGEGVGLVGMRYLAVLDAAMPVLSGWSARPRLVAGRGDFEALNPSTLQSVGLDPEAFRRRCEASQEALRNATSYQLETPQISDLAGGIAGWEELVEGIRARLFAGDYGCTRLAPANLEQMLEARLPLYRAWFGAQLTREQAMRQLLSQGAEYAAMGQLAADLGEHVLVLGADHVAMSVFYTFTRPIAVLYVERNYK